MVDYVDPKGEKRPEYILSKRGILQMAARYDAVIRYRLISCISELEQKVLQHQKQLYDQQEKLYQRDTETIRMLADELAQVKKREKRRQSTLERLGL